MSRRIHELYAGGQWLFFCCCEVDVGVCLLPRCRAAPHPTPPHPTVAVARSLLTLKWVLFWVAWLLPLTVATLCFLLLLLLLLHPFLDSTSSLQLTCPMGSYSLSAAGSCSPCPTGRYGSTTSMAFSLCTGTCTGGYACPAGSSNSTAIMCPLGKFSLFGAPNCTDCPGGCPPHCRENTHRSLRCSALHVERGCEQQ